MSFGKSDRHSRPNTSGRWIHVDVPRRFGRWYDGRALTDACRCGHDVGTHRQRTSGCTGCACEVFRPAPVARHASDLEESW